MELFPLKIEKTDAAVVVDCNINGLFMNSKKNTNIEKVSEKS